MRFNPGGMVYGTVTIGAILATESQTGDTYRGALEGALVALALYWLSHSYATFTEWRSQARAAQRPGWLLSALRRESSILVGAVAPVLALLICWVGGAGLVAGVYAATWTAAGAVVLIEVVLGVRERLRGLALVGQVGLGAALGLLIILLRSLAH